MLKRLQIIALVLIGLSVCLLALWCAQHEKSWWLLPIPAGLAYTALISGALFGQEKEWKTKSVRFLFVRLLGSTKRAAIVCSSAAAAVAIAGVMVIRDWPEPPEPHADPEYVLSVNVFDKNPANPKAGALVTLRLLVTKEERTEVANEVGIAVFRYKKSDIALLLVKREPSGQRESFGQVKLEGKNETVQIDISIRAEAPKPGEMTVGLVTGPAIVQPGYTLPKIALGDERFQTDNVPWGLPGAEVVVSRRAYALGYDPQKRIPRWVAYKSQWSDERYDRTSITFAADELLPDAVPRAEPNDYRGSGFDRGHLVSPRDVVFRGEDAVSEAFLMSAVAPQTRWLNQRSWNANENYGRELIRNGGDLYVTAGPIFFPAPGSIESQSITLGPNAVAVPDAFFRVLTRRRPGGDPECMAFIVPNAAAGEVAIDKYRVPLSEVERLTGLRLFPKLGPARNSLRDTPVPLIW